MIEPTYRFVVLVDVPGDSIASAYSQLHHGMSSSFSGDWESADEAFDKDGEPIPAAELAEARRQGLWRMRKGRPNPTRQANPELKRRLMR